MPFILPILASVGSFLAANAPAITAATALAGTGVSVGETLANPPGGGGGATPSLAAPAAPTAPPATAPSAAYIASQAPNVQSQVGGTLAPASFSEMLASLTGNPGQASGIQQQLFGGSGGQGLTDLAASLTQPQQSTTQPGGGG